MKCALSCVEIKWFRLYLTQSSAVRELMLMVTYKMLGSIVIERNKQENTVMSMVIVVKLLTLKYKEEGKDLELQDSYIGCYPLFCLNSPAACGLGR